jgi:AraC-like DNA-binding protein
MSEALCISTGPFGRVALIDLDHSIARHAHSMSHILLKVDGSDCSCMVDNTLRPLTDRQFAAIDSWLPHAFLHEPGKPPSRLLALYIHPAWLASIDLRLALLDRTRQFQRIGGAITPAIRRMADQLVEAMLREKDNFQVHESLILGLFGEIVSPCLADLDAGRLALETSERSNTDWRILRAVIRLKDRSRALHSIDEVISETGMSRAHFFRRFEATMGLTPGLFHNVLRMERAYHLASKPDLSMRAVAANWMSGPGETASEELQPGCERSG